MSHYFCCTSNILTIKAEDDEGDNKCQEGDTVSISPCKPISKNKSWNVVNINNTGTDK
jgi:ribosomal protein S17